MRMMLRAAIDAVVGFWPVRMLVLGFDALVRRLMWAWGHVRLAALIRDRGQRCICHWNTEIKYPDRVTLGDRVIIGVNVTLGAAGGISLGNDVRLSKDAILETAGLDFRAGEPPYSHIHAPIRLEDGVWVGARAIILGGVTIGRNAVVAAGSIVTKDVPSGTTVAGIPARPIKRSS